MFKFKQFTIHQDRCAMKVGTDGVLLGAWANCTNATNILDIGTGTGLISLMIAQRNNKCNIDAIEIDYDAAHQASENTQSSPFSNRINIIHSSIQEFNNSKLYSLIVSNPPYFVNSLRNPDLQRSTARHTDSLTFEELISNSSKLLADEGTFCVIIPHDKAEDFISISSNHNLYPKRFTHVFSTIESIDPKRALLEFIKTDKTTSTDTLHENIIIEISRHVYTPEYIALTHDFYLKM